MIKRKILNCISSLIIIVFVLIMFLHTNPWPVEQRDYLVLMGEEESGASNIVSAIYLGYRAFDTLGETIVLLVAIIGTMGIIGELKRMSIDRHTPISFNFTLEKEKRESNSLRTHLLEVVTSKIGPIILLYGFYVMMYGHIWPGGGFQGGVIIASGIVFFFLGNPSENRIKANQKQFLHLLEATSFLLFILASLLSLLFHEEFFSNIFPLFHYPKERFVIFLNSMIGLKVGSSIALMSISMIQERKL
ncbi:MAG: hypothetical protein EOM67_07495 [Spirochaetia bacterium]|nr:hypothetical protein [Spirochaetia bacterium]